MAVTPDVDYVTLTGVVGAMVGDTATDPDKNPDFVPATEGTITLTPTVASVHVTDSSSGNTVAMVPFPIVCTIDAQGRLSFNGDTQVTLVDLGSSKVNPQVPRDKAAYNVTFSGVKMDTATVKLAGFGINPGPDDAGGDGTINLFDLQPLPTGSGGAAIARGMGVPPVTTAALGDVVTYDGTDIKWAPGSGSTDASDLTTGTLDAALLPDIPVANLPVGTADSDLVTNAAAKSTYVPGQVASSAPASPSVGDVWVDTSKTLFVPSCAFAYQASNPATIPTGYGSGVVIPMNVATYDSGGYFDAANNQFVIPADGAYKFAGAVRFPSNATGYRWAELQFSRQGGAWVTEIDNAVAGAVGAVATCASFAFGPFKLLAGDKARLFARQTSGADMTLSASVLSWLSVEAVA